MNLILVVDDETSVRYSFQRAFGKDFTVFTAESGKDALKQIEETTPDLIFLDIRLPQMSGLEVLQTIKAKYPQLLVIIMTAFGDTDTAIEAMKLGAFDYIVKPLDNREVKNLIERGIKLQQLVESVPSSSFSEIEVEKDKIIGNSRQMQEVYKLIGQIAQTEATALICGESGTGKELVARSIHHHSLRRDKPFLVVNCAAIPETLLESELFGYEKGAFTGAGSRKIGKFEQGHQGTLFLDEIGDMPLSTQAKILRVLQEQTFERLGSIDTIRTNTRIIAATNKDLGKAIKEKAFREDLFFRLNVINIFLPPLRERMEDLPELLKYFIKKSQKNSSCPIQGVSPEVIPFLQSYSWPGNVRELENVVRRAVTLSRSSVLTLEDFTTILYFTKEPLNETTRLHRDLMGLVKGICGGSEASSGKIYFEVIEEAERCLVERALERTGYNQMKAAKLLGINRITLRKKMAKYHLERNSV